jgi:hypothetical protein
MREYGVKVAINKREICFIVIECVNRSVWV